MLHLILTYVLMALPLIAIYSLYRMYYVGQLKPGPNADILGTASVSGNIYHQLLLNSSAITFNMMAFYFVLRKYGATA